MRGELAFLGIAGMLSCADAMLDSRDAEVPADAEPSSDAAVPSQLTLVRTWGGRGTDPGQFIEPSSIELDSVGFVIVAGHEDRVQKFTADGELVAIWGTSGAGDLQFNHPHGLAIDRSRGDLIYVGDQENHRLQVLDRDGAFVRGWGDAKFEHIHDIGIDRQTGEIFVGDYASHILRRFTPTGDLLAELGGPGVGPGQFNGVWGISTNSRGEVFVADTFNRRIQVFDRSGAYVREWGGTGSSDFQKPTGVFVGADDVVHVCDSLAQTVALFDREGTLLELWDLAEILGWTSEPEDIVLDPAGRKIYIAEVRMHRVIQLSRP